MGSCSIFARSPFSIFEEYFRRGADLRRVFEAAQNLNNMAKEPSRNILTTSI